MSKAELEREVAQIIDETAYCMRPEAYGLKTEQEMLDRTLVGPMRSIAIKKARQIIALVQKTAR